MNRTHDTTSNHTFCSRDSKIAEVVYPILYSIIFIISFTLNSLAIWIFFKIKKTRSFDFYLKNLAMSDLLMTLTYPFKILSKSDLAPWQLTWFVCRYSEVIFYLSMYASILFLSLISLDRCLKIVNPFRKSKMHDINRARMFSAGVWLLVLVLGVPNSILTNKKATAENVKHCNSLKSPFGKHWHEAAVYICTGIFFIGFLILVVCYIFIMKEILKSKKTFSTATNKNYKMNQNIAWVVAVFFICFVPYHLWRLSFTVGQMHGNFSCSVESVWFHGREFTLFLAACNGSLDPIIYFFMSKSFQELLLQKIHIKTEIPDIRLRGGYKRANGHVSYDSTV